MTKIVRIQLFLSALQSISCFSPCSCLYNILLTTTTFLPECQSLVSAPGWQPVCCPLSTCLCAAWPSSARTGSVWLCLPPPSLGFGSNTAGGHVLAVHIWNVTVLDSVGDGFQSIVLKHEDTHVRRLWFVIVKRHFQKSPETFLLRKS